MRVFRTVTEYSTSVNVNVHSAIVRFGNFTSTLYILYRLLKASYSLFHESIESFKDDDR